MKLSGGSPSFAAELNVDAFLEQVSWKHFVRQSLARLVYSLHLHVYLKGATHVTSALLHVEASKHC